MKTSLTGKREGFTLLELIVAITIIGVVTGVVGPSFFRFIESVEGKSLERKVLKLCNQARAEAITSKTVKGIVINENNLVYITNSQKKIVFDNLIKESSLENEEKNNILSFFPDGTSSGGIISLTTTNNRSLKIEVNSVTGKAELGLKE